MHIQVLQLYDDDTSIRPGWIRMRIQGVGIIIVMVLARIEGTLAMQGYLVPYYYP